MSEIQKIWQDIHALEGVEVWDHDTATQMYQWCKYLLAVVAERDEQIAALKARIKELEEEFDILKLGGRP